MTEQPEGMENVDQPANGKGMENFGQPEPFLSLNYATRDRLMVSLNQLSAILQCDAPIPDDVKQRVRQKTEDCVRLLMDLLPFKLTPSTDSSGVFEKMVCNRLAVQLSKAERSKMIDQLISIRQAVQFDNLTTAETKRSLVTENNRILRQLIGGPAEDTNNVQNGESASKKHSTTI